MEGGNAGGGGSCWSYREETGSDVSSTVCGSRSGTIVSSAYTSSTSRHSTIMSAEKAAMLFDLEIYGDEAVFREDAEEEEDIGILVQEFFVHCSTNGGNMSVLERWFTELGVAWVFHISDCASETILELTAADAQIWIRALDKIMNTIHRSSASLLPRRRTSMGVLTFSCEVEEEEEEEAKACCTLDQLQVARFVKESMLKMVAFVDVMVDLYHISLMAKGVRRGALYQKSSILLLVHNSLSEASSQIKGVFHSKPTTEIKTIWDEIVNLLDAKDDKACEFIWTALEATSTWIMELMEDMAATITPQESSDIHKVTRLAMDHTTFLLNHHSALDSIIPEDRSFWLGELYKHYIPNVTLFHERDTLDSFIMKMASSLEEKLVSLSKSFSDQGLRFLFLLNNSYFMREQLEDSHLKEFGSIHLTYKVNEYMDTYIDVSWAPVLSCLLEPTPLCFHKNYSSISKFESEFHKTYTTHKMWKVPNPELRIKLRIAVTKKFFPRYTRFGARRDNNVTTVKVGPRELEEMLQDLFEG